MKIFPDFLNNNDIYNKAVMYWKKTCEEILRSTGEYDCWGDWLNVGFSDGTPFYDGNPIYSLINKTTHRALKIIQVDDDIEFDIWEKKIESCNELNDVLVVYCMLSSENSTDIKKILRWWFDGYNVNEINRKLECNQE